MNLNKLLKIPNIKFDQFNHAIELSLKFFEHYNLDIKTNKDLVISKPNPNPKNDDDLEIMDFINVDYVIYFTLKNCNHSNFDFKCFYYNGDIYIYEGVYYYANYNADLLRYLLTRHLTTNNYVIQSYRDWANMKAYRGDKFANHNYKIDKEDLLKIGIKE